MKLKDKYMYSAQSQYCAFLHYVNTTQEKLLMIFHSQKFLHTDARKPNYTAV